MSFVKATGFGPRRRVAILMARHHDACADELAAITGYPVPETLRLMLEVAA